MGPGVGDGGDANQQQGPQTTGLPFQGRMPRICIRSFVRVLAAVAQGAPVSLEAAIHCGHAGRGMSED